MLNPEITSQELLDTICLPVVSDLQATNHLICTELTSPVPLIQEITSHIINSGGKRLRPLLVLLSTYACGYSGDDTEHHELAAIIEFIHTATLLHDDVVDASTLRRGHKTANALWGNPASVLVGDFMYSRAFQILARRNNIPIMKCLADATNAIAEGEVQQLINQHNPNININEYYQVIYHKTAKLFESAAKIGAIIAKANAATEAALADYGLNLGMTFQIIDDLLDYCANSETLGKNVGDDLAEGKVTLPLIIAMQACNPTEKALIQKAAIDGNRDDIAAIIEIIKKTNTVEITQEKAAAYAEKAVAALDGLPDSACRQAMEQLVEFSLQRGY